MKKSRGRGACLAKLPLSKLNHAASRAEVIERDPIALLTCEQDGGLDLRDGKLAVGLPKRNQANTGAEQIGDVASQESRQRQAERNFLLCRASPKDDCKGGLTSG